MNNNFDNPFYENNNDMFPELNTEESNSTHERVEFRKERNASIIGIGCYLITFYVIATFIQIVLMVIFASKYNVSIANIMDSPDAYYATLSWSNFLTYVVALIAVVPFMFKYLKKDVKIALDDKKETLKHVLLGIGIMYATSIFANLLVQILTLNLDASGSSENQEVIEELMGSGTVNALLMCITTVFFAPILEEIIFRKCLFGLFKKKTYLTIAISAIIFAGIHVVPACLNILLDILMQGGSTLTDLYIEAVYIISYLGQAIAMSYIYYRSKFNIVPSILIHLFNNVLAVLALFLV